MSFYRTLLTAVAAIAIASPVFADETTTTQNPSEAMPIVQTSENSNATQAAPAEEAAAPAAEETKVNLNKATVKELVKVKGLNASKARAIVAYRKKHGEFKSTSDLVHVKGFKKMKADTLKDITDQLTVE